MPHQHLEQLDGDQLVPSDVRLDVAQGDTLIGGHSTYGIGAGAAVPQSAHAGRSPVILATLS